MPRWKRHPVFTSLLVSTDGRVRGPRGEKKQTTDNWGYRFVSITHDGKQYVRRVHRLVLETYRGLRPKGFEGRHLFGDKADNRLKRLAWGTRADNYLDRARLKETAVGTAKPNAILTEALVTELRQRVRNGEHVVDLAASLGFQKMTITNAVVGRSWKHVQEPPVSLPKNRWKRNAIN